MQLQAKAEQLRNVKMFTVWQKPTRRSRTSVSKKISNCNLAQKRWLLWPPFFVFNPRIRKLRLRSLNQKPQMIEI